MQGRRRTGVTVAAALGLALAVLAACGPKPSSPDQVLCAAPAPSVSALDRKAAHCTAVIGVAKGDALRAALVSRGEAYRLEGADQAAKQDFDHALGLDANDVAALNGRGLVYLDQGDYAHATADFDQAIRLQPGSGSAYVNRGVAELRQGDLRAALRDENRAIELEPKSAGAWTNRGFVFLGWRRWELALADFADALRLDPNLPAAMDGRGQADAGKGDGTGAAAAFAQAATAYIDAGRYPAALAEANRALAAKPDDASSLNLRCWTRAIANQELPLALADCQRSLQVRPNDANTLDSEAFVHFRLGDWRAAIAGYDAALKQDPKLAASIYMRGVAKLRAGDRTDGEDDIATAQDMDGSVAAQFAAYGVRP